MRLPYLGSCDAPRQTRLLAVPFPDMATSQLAVQAVESKYDQDAWYFSFI